MNPVRSNDTIIIGGQWGDEGKGKITDIFAQQADLVVRFQGGNNAGHTLVNNGVTYKLHLIPSGVLYEHTHNIIGAGVLVDPGVLRKELETLAEAGIVPNISISQRAHVIMPYHIAVDSALSELQGKLAAGSTKRGIAPVCADKAYRHGIRVGDLLDPDILREKLAVAYKFNVLLLKALSVKFDRSEEDILDEYIAHGQAIAHYVCNTSLLLQKARKDGKKVVFEGAQGMSLDPDFGAYPHGTSTNNIASYAGVGSGAGQISDPKTIAVVKAYTSRVGQGPFPSEIEGVEAELLREQGHEYGTTTGRPRRVGWIDLVQVRQTIGISGVTDVACTKVDVLDGYETVKVCTAYEIDGKRVEDMPAQIAEFRKAKPIYEEFPGWNLGSPEAYLACAQEGYHSLPETLRNFIEYIETQTDSNISIISYGPDRVHTMYRYA